MLFNKLTVTALFCVCTIAAISQPKNSKVKFGDIKPEDFKPEYYTLDSSADAVYLYDYGSSHHEGNAKGWFSVIYNVHERIRLMHTKSFDDLGTVKIYLYINGQDKEQLDKFEAATYNLNNGTVEQTKIDKSSVFYDKDGDYQIVKFTFPNLKEGSIIEYNYTTKSPFYNHIPTWYFQGSYPRLYSQFSIEEPQFFDFVVLKQGYLNPTVDTSILSADNFNVLDPNGISESKSYNIRSNTIKHTWIFKDIPALKQENFITTLSNYVQKLEFQFSAIRFPNETPQTFLTTWNETVDQLMKDEDFGADLSKANGWLKDDVRSALKDETNPLNKARNIYAFVRDNYTCTDNTAIYLSQPLKKTQQLAKGNVADINLVLVAMLKEIGFAAAPVLVSTRDHGKPYEMYPILSKFNYVIAQVLIDNKQYLLDATDQTLGFGSLSKDCYNGYARLIAAQPYLINLSPDSLHESEITSLFLANDADGKITGTYKHVMNEIQSEEMRSKMKKINKDEYFKDVKKSFSLDVDLDNKIIDSLKQPEMPVSVQYDLSFKPEEDIIYFTPMFADAAYKQNPFNAAQRFYPVEMPYCSDETYILNMEIPTGYKVDEIPKAARVSLNDGEGIFEYLIQKTDDHIQLRCRTKLNKATFEPDDYETLRNFFAFVVEKEGEQIVFKKQ